MNSNPLISIIIPIYNAAQYLPQCIDSILSQTYQLWECILIDDGSTDNSFSICKIYSARDSRIKVIQKENEGVSIARNWGIERAIGEFITFIDADDWVEPYYLECLIVNSNYDIVFFPYIKIYSNGENVSYKLKELEASDEDGFWNIVEYLKSNEYKVNFYGFTWNKLFRSKIIKQNNVRFVHGLKVSEDEVFTLNYSLFAESIKVLSIPLYNYRVLTNSLTRAKKNASEQLLLARSFMNLIEKKKNFRIKRCFIPQIANIYCGAALMEPSIVKVYEILRESAYLVPFADVKILFSSIYMRLLFTMPLYIRIILIYIRKIKK